MSTTRGLKYSFKCTPQYTGFGFGFRFAFGFAFEALVAVPAAPVCVARQALICAAIMTQPPSVPIPLEVPAV